MLPGTSSTHAEMLPATSLTPACQRLVLLFGPLRGNPPIPTHIPKIKLLPIGILNTPVTLEIPTEFGKYNSTTIPLMYTPEYGLHVNAKVTVPEALSL